MLLFLFKLLVFLYVGGTVTAVLINKKLRDNGFSGIKYRECFNVVKQFSVCIGLVLKYLIPLHIFEQYVLRFYDPYCRKECINKGECTVCGCDAVAKAWSPLEKCSGDNWPPIIFSKKAYYKHREEFPAHVNIKYGNKSI